MTETFQPADVQALFTRADGSFLFARWGRPVAPVVIGVDDATLAVVKGSFEAVATLTGRPMLAETDPELGTNCMMFFFRDWDELADVPDLDRLVPDLSDLLVRLQASGANQYRFFRFDAAGAIKAGFVFLRMNAGLSALPAEDLALAQVVQCLLSWSDTAFRERSPLARVGNRTILRPDIAALIRAAYDPVLPDMAQDPSLALRLAARMGQGR
ncbi:MAG: hypothetical protein CML68_03035 [Rhodobacteraceae bacterium]|nr:hypothetical protein [Paracoccaceae bacterium]